MRKNAFTLIELLVVIVVIAVLVGMLIPAISMVQSSARSTKCLSNLRQQGLAFTAYAQEYNDAVPPIKLPNMHNDGRHWYNLLAPYYGVREKAVDSGFSSSTDVSKMVSVFWGCPAWRGRTWDTAGANKADQSPGYGMNVYPNLPTDTSHSNFHGKYWGNDQRVFRLSAITYPATRVLIGDGNDWAIWGNNVPAATADYQWVGKGKRHRDKANFLFYDLHVSAIPLGKIPLAFNDPSKFQN